MGTPRAALAISDDAMQLTTTSGQWLSDSVRYQHPMNEYGLVHSHQKYSTSFNHARRT
ncbi:MAG: hypothetical protein WBQ26_05950 [Gemmatimonadaceae bacterium]